MKQFANRTTRGKQNISHICCVGSSASVATNSTGTPTMVHRGRKHTASVTFRSTSRTGLHVPYARAAKRSPSHYRRTYPTPIILREAWTDPPAANRGAPGLILRIRPLSTVPPLKWSLEKGKGIIFFLVVVCHGVLWEPSCGDQAH
jgi:hypothetical protein